MWLPLLATTSGGSNKKVGTKFKALTAGNVRCKWHTHVSRSVKIEQQMLAHAHQAGWSSVD